MSQDKEQLRKAALAYHRTVKPGKRCNRDVFDLESTN